MLALFSEKFRDDWREIQLKVRKIRLYQIHADILNAKKLWCSTK